MVHLFINVTHVRGLEIPKLKGGSDAYGLVAVST
jgi:hypothetical protein